MARIKQSISLPIDDAALLSNRVQALRREKDWSQQKLAERADLSIGTIRAIETKRCKDPGVFTVRKIAHAFGCSIDELVAPTK
jgi:transcriptional regulator with XRE-family HTH domain